MSKVEDLPLVLSASSCLAPNNILCPSLILQASHLGPGWSWSTQRESLQWYKQSEIEYSLVGNSRRLFSTDEHCSYHFLLVLKFSCSSKFYFHRDSDYLFHHIIEAFYFCVDKHVTFDSIHKNTQTAHKHCEYTFAVHFTPLKVQKYVTIQRTSK